MDTAKMSVEKDRYARDTGPKVTYTSPRIMEHGTITAITLGNKPSGQYDNPWDVNDGLSGGA